jgi:CelD/BcsL family acetyltransferase involved in cellulose biosynthesis
MSHTASLSASIERLTRVTALELTPAKAREAAAWDDFVEEHPEGRFCHLWAYRRVLEQAYGYKCAYFKILDGCRMVGVFPSIVVRRGLGCLVSQPFNEYGGPLTRNLPEEQAKLLPQALMRAAGEEGCQSVQIRGGIGCEVMAQTELCIKHPLHSYALLNIEQEEQLWRKSLTNEARKGVNRSRRAGLTAHVRSGLPAIEGPFYHLYLASMKRLGVPPHSPIFFAELAKRLGDRFVAAWVMMNKADPVAILLGAVTGRRIHIFITASDSRAWPARPNDLAHWELIQWAASVGLHTFDFGSARYSSQIQFKKKWGASLYDYCYYSIGPSAAARSSVKVARTSSPLFVVMSHLWKWIMPNNLAQVLGPPIRRYLTK